MFLLIFAFLKPEKGLLSSIEFLFFCSAAKRYRKSRFFSSFSHNILGIPEKRKGENDIAFCFAQFIFLVLLVLHFSNYR